MLSFESCPAEACASSVSDPSVITGVSSGASAYTLLGAGETIIANSRNTDNSFLTLFINLLLIDEYL